MKTYSFQFLGAILLTSVFACKSSTSTNASADSLATDTVSAGGTAAATSSYVNLSTGEPVTIVRDEDKGYYVYSDTKKPIEKDLYFVDATSRDTLYGPTGLVVNNALIKSSSGSYTLNEQMVERDGDEIKIKTADGKLKIDGDEVKYKEGEDIKSKSDGNESKVKTADSKTKTDGNETKIKTEDTKIKIDN